MIVMMIAFWFCYSGSGVADGGYGWSNRSIELNDDICFCLTVETGDELVEEGDETRFQRHGTAE